MADQEFKEVDDETRARGVKRTSDNKITEVSTSKSKKRTRKAQVETPEAADAQNLFDDPLRRSENYLKRSRLERAARDVADGKISLEELDKALHDAVTDRNIRLVGQGAFYNVSEQPAPYEFSMEAFQRLARAIAARQERTAELMRNAKPLPASGNQLLNVSSSSVKGLSPSFPITEPQLLASTSHPAAMTPSRAIEPPASGSTTVGAYPMLQLYASPFSVAQSTHGQRTAAHDTPGHVVPDSQVPAQSQHWHASALTTVGAPSMSQHHVFHPSVAQSTHGQHTAAHDTLHVPPAAQVPAQSQHWQASVLPTVGGHSTFQPYAVAPTVTVPVCGQLKVAHLAQADHHFLEQL